MHLKHNILFDLYLMAFFSNLIIDQFYLNFCQETSYKLYSILLPR